MAQPTVTSVTPSSGVSRGGFFVTIAGTNFDTTVDLDATPTTPNGARVTVTFGGLLATEVKVVSSTTLTCVVPRGELADAVDSLALDVVVTNIDDALPNAGTLTSGFTYRRPDLTNETHLTGVVRTLLKRLKQQVIKNVAITTHVDWDNDTGDMLNRIELAKLPAIFLVGPTMTPHTIQNFNGRRVTLIGSPDPTDFTKHRHPVAVDLIFQVHLMTTSKVELLNLTHHAIAFQRLNAIMTDVLLDPLNPGAGVVGYGLNVLTPFTSPDRPTRANVREAIGVWAVEGVLVDSDDLLESAPVITDPELTSEQIS